MNVDFDEVRASGISRHFGRRRALSQITFSCRAGEVLGLLGPNGAGKSTLLAIVSTLLRPSAGHLLYGAHDVSRAGAPLRQRLGWLGHDLQLYPELTARENLTFFAHLQGVTAVDARVILFQCPKSFLPTSENLMNFSAFFRRVGRGSCRLAFEPRGETKSDGSAI